jgi:hypothetical protein
MTTRLRPLGSVRAPLSNILTTPPLHWTSWSVTLQELQCLSLPDSAGRKPYIWPVLVWFDDFTKTTPERVGITGPVMQNVSVPLAQDMHVGDTVAIPATVGNVGTYTFEDSDVVDPKSLGHNLVLVVALFEHHDFDEDVIAAGYTVFQSSLQEAIAYKLADLLVTIASGGDPSSILSDINTVVHNAVKLAFQNAIGDDVAYAVGIKHADELVDSQNGPLFHDVMSASDINLQIAQSTQDPHNPDLILTTQYTVVGQLQVNPAVSVGLPFDCASGGPYPPVNLGSLSGNQISHDLEDGDATLDNVSETTLGLTSRHGAITINHKVDQHSSVALTACKGVDISEKIDNQSHATIVARGNVSIGQKIDQHSTADINSQTAIDIGQKIDQHSVAKLNAGTTIHIGQKIDQHSTATIIAEGDINIDQGIDQHSTAYITSLNGSITIGQAVDGQSFVTLRAPNGNVTIKQKVARGSTVNFFSPNPLQCPDQSGTVNQLPALPPLP